MSISEILDSHQKESSTRNLWMAWIYPIILDSNNEVISFPPIINGNHTTVSEDTNDFFIDVTGFDEIACETCLLLVSLSLSELGGLVESVEVWSKDGSVIVTPNFRLELTESRTDSLRKSSVWSSVISKLAKRFEEWGAYYWNLGPLPTDPRGLKDGPTVVGEKEHVFSMPRWRSDIMHPVDIVEDIAIGFGYENLPDILSSVHIDASPLKSSNLYRRIRTSMRSVGLQEIQSLTLSNERDQFEKTRWPMISEATVISNPITVDHTLLRQYIFPSLMNLLASNRHLDYLRGFTNLGRSFMGGTTKLEFLGLALSRGQDSQQPKESFQSLLRDLGAPTSSISFEPVAEGEGPWIDGRGRVLIEDHEIGEFGEVSPDVMSLFGLRAPIHAGEFDIDVISKIIKDPIH